MFSGTCPNLPEMKYLFLPLFIACCCLSGLASGQKIKKRAIPPPPPPVISVAGDRTGNYDCAPRHHYTLVKRLKRYPFNKAAKVSIASFRTPGSTLFPADSLNKQDYDYDYGAVPDGKDSSNKCVFEELVVLDTLQLDSLTSLLYNYDYRKSPAVAGPRTMNGCYAPHNAILFYNEKQEIFAFIELCFTCMGIRESDDAVDLGVFCGGKYELFKSFFKKNNIHIGITQVPMEKMFDPGLK